VDAADCAKRGCSVKSARVFYCLAVGWMLLGAAACGRPRQHATLTVASAQSIEHRLASELTVQLLEARGYDVVDKTGYGEPSAVRAALEAGEVDICWEFTGETWLTHMGHDQPVTDADKLWEMLQKEDAARRILWLAEAGYHSNLTLWVHADLAREANLLTLSDLARYTRTVNSRTRLCTPPELYQSVQGVAGLVRAYGLAFDPSLVRFGTAEEGYRALTAGECDCALASSLEDPTSSGQVRALQDDRAFFVASNLAVAVRAPVLASHLDLQVALTDLAAALTQENMAALYRRVTVDGQEVDKAARAFLREHKLLNRPVATPSCTPIPAPTLTPTVTLTPEPTPTLTQDSKGRK